MYLPDDYECDYGCGDSYRDPDCKQCEAYDREHDPNFGRVAPPNICPDCNAGPYGTDDELLDHMILECEKRPTS